MRTLIAIQQNLLIKYAVLMQTQLACLDRAPVMAYLDCV